MNTIKNELKPISEEKKKYSKPQVKVIELKHRSSLLSCSGEDCVTVDFKDL